MDLLFSFKSSKLDEVDKYIPDKRNFFENLLNDWLSPAGKAYFEITTTD